MFLREILKLERFERSSDAVRIKATLVAGFALISVLLVDLVILRYLKADSAYGMTAICALIAVILLMFSYRFHKKFYVAGLGFTLIMSAMVYFGARIGETGIYTSFLPFLPLMIIVAGVISGWRMTLGSAAIASAVVALLVHQTMTQMGQGVLAAANSYDIFINRTMQLGLSCLMATAIGASLSIFMHGLFKRDELSMEKVRHAERQRTAFLSSLSHEIRTPLNGIVGMTNLLGHTDLSARQKQYTEIVAKCSEDLLDVMGTVMEFSQINNERIVLAPELFDIHALAHELVKKYAARISKTDEVILGLHIADQVPQHLYADPKRIEMVLNHLLSNAVHFTPKGSINLLINGTHVDKEKFRLCVYVRDTGVGIKPADLAEIYRPFHQLDNRLKREHEGTGLGLSLCKEIIEYMNGKINVISEFGSGSTFYFEMDLPTNDLSQSDNADLLGKLAVAEDLSNIAVFKKAV